MRPKRKWGEGVLPSWIPQAQSTTFIILTANIGLYIATAIMSGGADSPNSESLWLFGAKHRPSILVHGEYWRLITAGFLHGGLFHILMNSWVLWDLGAQVEEVFGTPRYVSIYVVSTITGFIASTMFSPALSVGASAGIFGLIGAMIAAGMRARTSLGEEIKQVYVRWAMYGLLMGLLPFFATDNAAHVGGLAGGFALAYLADLPSAFDNTKEKIWRIVSYLCLVLVGGAFLQWFLWFSKVTRN
ncbi:MAG: rhomboid family intramembrane serine protease [Bryobacteraceae bacterium]|nr:rhomboid family intramembrane serine protease [Bryobacteraceae bacterium]